MKIMVCLYFITLSMSNFCLKYLCNPFLILLTIPPLIYSQDSNLHSSQYFFKIKEESNVYSFESRETQKVKYQKNLEANNESFYISNPFYSELDKIEVRHNEDKLNKKFISEYTAESKDVFLTDNTFLHFTIPNEILKNDIVSYEIERSYNELVYLPIIYVPNENQLAPFTVEFEHPQNISIDFDLFFPRIEIPYKIIKNDSRKTTLVFDIFQKQEILSFFPFNDYMSAILVKIKNQDGVINATTPQSFVKWYGSKVNLNPKILDNKILEEHNLKIDSTDLIKGIISIYDDIKRRIRYISTLENGHSFFPRSPKYTLDNKYGDCKDKAYLMSALAEFVGEEINMALIAISKEPIFEGTHISLYDHVICHANINGTDVFFDPTCEECPFGVLPDYESGKEVLILNSDIPSIRAIKTPDVSRKIKVTIELDLANRDQGKTSIEFSGFEYVVFKYLLNSDNHIMKNARVNNYLNSFFDGVRFDFGSHTIIEDNGYFLTVEMEADFSRVIVEGSNNSYYFPSNILSTYHGSIAERQKDSLSLFFDGRPFIDCEVTITKSILSNDDNPINLGKEQWVEFRNSVAQNDSSILLKYNFHHGTQLIDKDYKNDFFDFVNQVKELDRKMIKLKLLANGSD